MKAQKKWRRILVGGLAALVLVLGATVTFAQTADDAPAVTDESQDAPGVLPIHWGRHGRPGAGPNGGPIWMPNGNINRQELLADALGISVEELEAAHEAANEAAIEVAVDEGRISREEADLMLALKAFRQTIEKDEVMAGALGISVAELEAAREEGTSLRELIDELGLDPATVRENLAAARDEMIEQAVEENILTREQADQILSGEGPGLGGFRGFRGGPGSGRPGLGFGNSGGFGGRGGFGNRLQNGNGALAPTGSI